MAKILGKDTATYSKDRNGFLRDLHHFHDTKGTAFKRPPTIGGKEVDLYLLYTLVTSQGGWVKVNCKNTWSEIFTQLELPRGCVNGSVALKQIYLRYLDKWEKVNFLHEDGDRASDDDDENKHKRWSSKTLHSVPATYNYSQHNIPEANREPNSLSTDIYRASDYDRLALSLISPLPNEQDFAINVCTLLSNDGKHTLRLHKHPRIINYLLAHAGVFYHSSLRKLFMHFYSDVRKKPIHNFWRDVIESKEFLHLTEEDKFKTKRDAEEAVCDMLVRDETSSSLLMGIERTGADNNQESDGSECEEITADRDGICDKFKIVFDETVDRELFCLKRGLGTQDYIGQRVLQIATILRNLSFIEDNTELLARNTAFLRFLLLCCTAQWNILRNLGMDMMGNVAAEFVIRDLSTDVLAADLLKIISKGLQTQDRSCCLFSLEVLNKLSQNEQNEDVLLRSLEANLFKNVCSFLTINDVMLLIYTLECLYSLSSLGERSCHLIVINHGVIDTLVSLVTVEGKSYGPKACIGMKLVETLPCGSGNVGAQQQQQPQQQQTQAQSDSSVEEETSSTGSMTHSSLSNVDMKVTPPSTPTRCISIAPQRLLSISPSPAVATLVTSAASVSMSTTVTSSPVTPLLAPAAVLHQPKSSAAGHQQPRSSFQTMMPQQTIQQQHAHQQAIHENEQFALAWLRATYEPCESNKIDHQELYKHYINSCSKIGRRGVISPLHFPRCVRSVFGGTVGPNPMKPASASDPQFYEGIKVRNSALLSIQQEIDEGQESVKRPLVVVSSDGSDDSVTPMPPSPASPILKAQLSAPPKQKDNVILKSDPKSQAVNHPHLSQALLGGAAASSSAPATVSAVSGASTNTAVTASGGGQASNTSLIKSLLATKVNDCMSTVSMRTATDCPNVAQVAARQQQQQRLLAQTGGEQQKSPGQQSAASAARINGMRQLFFDDLMEEDVSATDSPTTETTATRESPSSYLSPLTSSSTSFAHPTTKGGKREPPQPPPPPLAPLSNGGGGGGGCRPRTAQQLRSHDYSEDSDSVEGSSVASISGAVSISGIFAAEDGDNSLTCFEGLLNGAPDMDNPLNEDSSSKDSLKIIDSEISVNKPLRLADLLEKKFEKSSPLLNGSLGRDIKLGEKDLLENHIEKALIRDNDNEKYADIPIKEMDSYMEMEMKDETVEKYIDLKDESIEKEESIDVKEESSETLISLKRSSSEELIDVKAKKPMLSLNGNVTADSPNPDSVSSSNDEAPTTVSTAAAKLFADMAADILEDEDEEQLLQESQAQPPTQAVQITQGNLPQIIVDNNQQVLLTQPRQIIVSQPQSTSQVMISAGTPMKTQTGQTVIVQNSGVAGAAAGGQHHHQQQQQQQRSVLTGTGQHHVLLSTSQSHQVQLVQQGAYVVASAAQPQLLVAQTQQHQGGAQPKTIIILQQQQQVSTGSAAGGAHGHHQKVVMTPQGQQVVVTQMPRPVTPQNQTAANNASVISTINRVLTAKQPVTSISVMTTATVATTTTTTSAPLSSPCESQEGEKKDEQKKMKIVRDLSTPYVCEWGHCDVKTKFKSANDVFLHVTQTHCPTGNEEVTCLWDKCDNLKRRRFSLMTHIQDKHCNVEAMKQRLVKRKKIAQGAKADSPQPVTAASHPGYAPDAALHAIKRHALEFVNPKELQDDNEGPVTKSIRLTASLILRNLVIYSSHCKRYLKSYESHLANVALSNVESSRTIAQVLYDMNDGATHR